MNPEQRLIEEVIAEQDKFFKSHRTKDIDFRLISLKNLKRIIKNREVEIIEALYADLRKSPFEAFSSEIGLIYQEIRYHLRNLKKWAQPQKVPSPVYTFPSSSFILKHPFGRVLIISPFNYPFQLNLLPLIGAVSAGNTVVLKPSEFTSQTAAVIEMIISEAFDPEHVRVIPGGIETSQLLLKQRWDKIFFTGSQKVGRIVLEAAAKHLTPVVLEMGGKNPVIVDKETNLKIAASRIAWGKWLNSGQSCVAPDYLLIHSDIKEKFLAYFKKATESFFGTDPMMTNDFPRLISPEAVDRLSGFLKEGKIFLGGKFSREERYFSPTVVTDISPDSSIMQEEIFGPLLPVITFSNLDEAIEFVNKKGAPLALYYFSENSKNQKKVLDKTVSGDAGINEVVMHFANPYLPFGGVGHSGMGNYHGKRSFDIFSHERSVMKTSTRLNLPLRYPPYKDSLLKLFRIWFR